MKDNRNSKLAQAKPAISETSLKTNSKKVGFFSLFRYASKREKILVFFSLIFAVGHGVMIPIFSVIFGRIVRDMTPNKPRDEIESLAKNSCIKMMIGGAIAFVFAGIGVSLWKFIGVKVTENLKKLYFQKLLESEIGWFDLENPERLTTSFTENFSTFE